jgi:ribonuclease HII
VRALPAPSLPTIDAELCLLSQGYHLIAGVDEVGRGSWAGPVVAAAVILPLENRGCLDALDGLRDSKQLSPLQRAQLMERIRKVAVGVGVGWCSHHVVDRLGIGPANLRAMHRAASALPVTPDALLLDYFTLPACPLPQTPLTGGDASSLSIAAASVVAKVVRDRWMERYDSRFPVYGFARNKGYGTPYHQEALRLHGACPIHRRSYRPVAVLQP